MSNTPITIVSLPGYHPLAR